MVLIVHADGVIPGSIPFERMQAIAWRHAEIVELRHRVDLIQLAPDDRPQGLRNSPGRLAVHTVPHVPRRVVPLAVGGAPAFCRRDVDLECEWIDEDAVQIGGGLDRHVTLLDVVSDGLDRAIQR